MTHSPTSRTEYRERLRDLLPSRDASRVLEEVDGLLGDRIEAESAKPGVDGSEAERRALSALGTPEALAAELIDSPLTIDLATRRTFVRFLIVAFAVHLLLSIVLTVAGQQEAAIPGLLGPLPTSSLAAVFGGVLSIFLLDAGALLMLFAFLGRGKAPALLPELRLATAASRRNAILALVLLGLLAVILHPLRDEVFAVRDGGQLVGFLSEEVAEVLPLVDVALLLFALQQIVILWKRREHPLGVAADALGSLVLAVALVLVATRSTLVRFPATALGKEAADTLEHLVTRVFLLILLAGALFLTVRFVKRCFRLRQLLA